MPKAGVHTPITDAEAVEWVYRMMAKHPEPGATISASAWRAYLTRYFEMEKGYTPSAEQLMASYGGVVTRFEVLPEVGVSTFQRVTTKGTYLQYRDILTGRFLTVGQVAKRLEMR